MLKKTRAPKPVWTKVYTSLDELPAVCLVKEVACVLRMSEQFQLQEL